MRTEDTPTRLMLHHVYIKKNDYACWCRLLRGACRILRLGEDIEVSEAHAVIAEPGKLSRSSWSTGSLGPSMSKVGRRVLRVVL